jgi:mersacidin/lichenicidin family type 2 lantibiotic
LRVERKDTHMTIDMIRAWKDDAYREALSERERSLLPENPAGAIELTEHELSSVDGGQRMTPVITRVLCDPMITWLMACQ